MAVADRKGGRKPTEGTSDHFEKLLEGPCPNHAFPVKHLYKDCGLMKQFLSEGSNKGEHGKDSNPTTDDTKEKDGGFLMPDGCLMIFRGLEAYDSKRRQKVTHREVYMTKLATPTFLRWSKSAITFDRTNHTESVPQPGRYPLMVDLIVLMDGGSGLNIMYERDTRRYGRRLSAHPANQSAFSWHCA